MTVQVMNKMGRPRKPEYRKKKFRLSCIEDKVLETLKQMENEKDKKLVINFLEDLKSL